MKKSAVRSRVMLAASVAVPLALASSSAEANIFEAYGDIYIGGMYGTEPKFNSVVTQKPDMTQGDDFFHYNSGGLVGARLGVELLHTDLYLQFDQFFGPKGAGGSDLQLMLGWDTTIGLKRWRGVVGAYGGMVFAFPYTPQLPIDKAQIAWLGVAAEGQAGVEYNVGRFLVLQGLGTFGYHYMFSGAQGVQIDSQGNTLSTTTHGFHLMFKLGARFHLGI